MFGTFNHHCVTNETEKKQVHFVTPFFKQYKILRLIKDDNKYLKDTSSKTEE